ncbi:MAG: 4-alpha-glucanotransferase [Prevotella sp.]|jgi:4-alpha-glucanotransferase|nr:4-alpha-glucanotransferase [Prevotella sp.]MCI2079686.1 4-alpha-glucanotransferase [Prevotella sp.]MCI2101459.1 4-alpha-glucanotransferase [Prevotella sp.]
MNLNFNIDYRTNFGEDLVLNRIEDDKQGGEKISQYRMNTVDGNRWSYQMVLPQQQENTIINYFYSVANDSQNRRKEWLTETHRVELTASRGISYTLYDHWNDMPEDTYLYSSAFTECINRRAKGQLKASDYERTVRFFVRMPQLRAHQHVCIVGAGDALGNWNVQKALPMVEHQINEWVIDLNADDFKEGKIEFKFVALNDQDDNNSVWESGLNRTVELPVLTKGDVVVYDLSQAFLPVYDQKVAGTLVPVFSLRSKTSFGVGDFGDLKKMVDWVAATHQRALQILPINDTTITHTWTDSYPYSCISIFALHPQYVDLTQLPAIKDQATRSKFEKLRKELNALKQIDYERVNEAKTDYLRVIYSQERAKVMKSTDFKKFFKETEQWLVPYAQYCYLRDSQGTADFTQWKGHQVWDEADRKALSSATTTAYRQVEFYYFVQYILNRQMEAVHDYARSKGVILKGDIPIGVNRYGCDVWMEPKYFNMNGQAGAPPDDFSVNGQNWGFPTYNWDEMLKDDCIWWVRRFQNMSKFFDAYRIDHVLGFFRIWEIPIEAVHGLLGQFSPSLGMTPAEIEAYGLHFQEDLFTRPFITDWVLDRMFHERAQLVKDTYLDPYKEGYYQMKPAYDTQRKIEAAFEGKTSKEDTDLRDGLYALVSDVLFVRDRKDCHKFHPRISVQFDFIYESLYDCDKAAFNRLYNDYYYRRNNQFWYYEAMKKLPKLVQATRMLVCAEDLGMVPDCVAWVMNELRILSLEIQSMPKDPKVRFGHLSRNPYRSVCTISSHDMPTLRQWWDEDTHRTQEYYNTMLYRSGAAPHPLPGWLARDIISRHLTSPSMLCILSIQDWLSIDEKIRLADENAERINIPANPKHYWRYRMHLNIEDLLANPDFTANISELILQSGRK